MASNKTHQLVVRLLGFLESRRFYLLILGLFVFESAWIAFSALYPQAFDEDFHFGLIRLYSHHWLPFLSGQPAGADAYGAVARDPSYLFHYLMSFPYRLLALFTTSQTALVIAMRLIDIAFVAVGLILFKRVLRRVGVSHSLANVSLLLFVLIPIVPQLAAQVNYDNLLFALTAWTCLQAFDLIDQIKQRKPQAASVLKLAVTLILASVVKYAFMPIALAVALYLAVVAYRAYRSGARRLWSDLVQSFRAQTRLSKIVLPLALVLSIGLFAQRTGYNVITYHSVVPDCSTIVSVQQCSAYGPWNADHNRHQAVLSGQNVPHDNLVQYTDKWFYGMWYRLFFAINGPGSNFTNYPPLAVPSLAAVVLAVVSFLAVIRWRARLFHNNHYLMLLLAICLIYCLSLFTKGYATYKYTAVLENMNGRYLLPILFPVAAMGGLALSLDMRRSAAMKLAAAMTILVLFVEGGGLLNFLINSDSSWYWPNSTVNSVNHAASQAAKHVVIQVKAQ